jgi:hypothetical protein
MSWGINDTTPGIPTMERRTVRDADPEGNAANSKHQ